MTAYPETIGTLVVEVEGGLHMAAVCTYAGQAPPFKDAELVDFMARVRQPCCSLNLKFEIPA